jgi:DNA-binding transcriptional LysR family regulator
MYLDQVAVFVRVVEAGSFSGAAERLEMPKSTVSRRVSQLEERLGVRLLQRTTRKLRLTDEGRAYYQVAAEAVAGLENAERVVMRSADTPRGLLRVTAPVDVGSVLGGVVLPRGARVVGPDAAQGGPGG